MNESMMPETVKIPEDHARKQVSKSARKAKTVLQNFIQNAMACRYKIIFWGYYFIFKKNLVKYRLEHPEINWSIIR
jgi:hypothetical protein